MLKVWPAIGVDRTVLVFLQSGSSKVRRQCSTLSGFAQYCHDLIQQVG